MDAAIISLLATLIATMFGGFWLLWRTIHKDNTAIRKEMAEQITAIRQDMAKQDIAIRQDMAKQIADLRQEMAKQTADLRKEMAEQKHQHPPRHRRPAQRPRSARSDYGNAAETDPHLSQPGELNPRGCPARLDGLGFLGRWLGGSCGKASRGRR